MRRFTLFAIAALLTVATFGQKQGHIKDDAAGESVEAIDPDGLTYSFDDGTMEGWTTIDADGDGYTWVLGSEAEGIYLYEGTRLAGYGRNGSADMVVSGSYSSMAGALTPDNYLVSPKFKLGAPMKFYASALDAEYPAERFGVYVSTESNTSPDDFQPVSEEWEMTASRVVSQPAGARNLFRGPKKVQGRWYEYTVDLSAYEGQEGYVAIRHFDSTDNFLLDIDDISFGTPPFEIEPAEVLVESLSDFKITFNKYDITVAEDATATLVNTTTLDTYATSFDVVGNTILISFDEVTESGKYTLTIQGVSKDTGEPIENLVFNYTIERAITELPDGVYPETWYLDALEIYRDVLQEVQVAIDETDMYIRGLDGGYIDEEVWVKGTITADGTTVVFPKGQFFGEYYDEPSGQTVRLYFLGYDTASGGLSDVVFKYDADAGRLSTDTDIFVNVGTAQPYVYDLFTMVEITRDAPELPEPVEVPEGLKVAKYGFNATRRVWVQENNAYADQAVYYPIMLGFGDHKDVYFKGLHGEINDDIWAKGTLSEDGKTVTIPANQFMGVVEDSEDEKDYYYVTSADADRNLQDIVLSYDAKAGKFITDQPFYINSSRKGLYPPYNKYENVVIKTIVATPADPEIENLTVKGVYPVYHPKAYFIIPDKDVDDNPMLTSLLYYTVWVEEGNVEKPFVVTAAAYRDVTEDMTEIPYDYDDHFDIFTGGSEFYFNPTNVVTLWTKIGIQSIYYGGDDCKKSNIVWKENPAYDPTTVGIADVNVNDSKQDVFFDLQGRRVDAPAKGLYIANGRKVVIK